MNLLQMVNRYIHSNPSDLPTYLTTCLPIPPLLFPLPLFPLPLFYLPPSPPKRKVKESGITNKVRLRFAQNPILSSLKCPGGGGGSEWGFVHRGEGKGREGDGDGDGELAR